MGSLEEQSRWAVWIPAVILECFIFTITAIRAWQYSTSAVAYIQLPLVRTLYRDGFQYFIVIMLCSFFPLFVWAKAPMSLAALPKYVTMGIVNVMASRIILNTRAYSRNPNNLAYFDEYELPSRETEDMCTQWRVVSSRVTVT
ncbi:hypothetical protein FRC08_006630 [Ceratobasidium sp. 394]|nr:hypothetical protein FRC08_006630 [Ceratobasidium sp. 394]